MQAYAQYQRNAYDEAINAAQRFITLHPGHKDAAYAYYLVALCNYEQIIDIRRDQTKTQKALASLEEVSRRYPGTAYAQDAEAKAVLARDHLAGKEMEVGRYYLKKGSYLAGINRFKTVVTDYQTTSHTPEALYRLTECYMALGVRSEAQTAAAVLGHNYPNSEWYKDAYALLQTDGLAAVGEQGVLDQPGLDLDQSVLNLAGLGLRNLAAETGHFGGARLARLSYKGAMLTALSIRDIVLIEKLDLALEDGLTVLTGETGAGKSILLDALGLALGARGDIGLVRTGADKGVVTAAFALAQDQPPSPCSRAGDRSRWRAGDAAHPERRWSEPRLHQRSAGEPQSAAPDRAAP